MEGNKAIILGFNKDIKQEFKILILNIALYCPYLHSF